MLKKICPVFIFSICYILTGNGQVVHKPDDLYKISHDSKLEYTVSKLNTPVPDNDYSNILNESGVYNEDSNGTTTLKKIHISGAAESEWGKGNSSFRNKEYKDARQHYKNVLDIQPDYYPASVQIAKSFEGEEDYDKAVTAYKQAISKNYIDYTSHWYLADAYFNDRKYDDAVNEITIASILNRNDTAILADMKKIYLEAHLKFDYWIFTPQCKVSKDPKSREVKVQTKNDWEGYAIVKAIWEFEPGYAESQGEKPGIPSLLEEKECLTNLIAGQDKHVDAVFEKPIAILKKAQEYKLIDGFAYYEELLPAHPSLAYQLPTNVIKTIKNYVVLGHGGEAPKKK